jgi:hypothetical protein
MLAVSASALFNQKLTTGIHEHHGKGDMEFHKMVVKYVSHVHIPDVVKCDINSMYNS